MKDRLFIFIKFFQTYPWEHRTPGKPSHQGVYQKGCLGKYYRQDRPFLDHRCNHRLYISTFPSDYSSENSRYSSNPPNPPFAKGGQGGLQFSLFQYFVIVNLLNGILVLTLLLDQEGEEIF